MQATTRIGLVGLNARVERVVLPGLASSPRAAVAAVCSRDLAKAERFAAAYPGCRPFGDYGQMLASGELEAVFVLTPAPLHAEMSIAAIEAGLATCCEKPLARSRGEAQAMVAAAERRGVRTAVNFTYRSTTAHRLLARELGQVGIGRLHELSVAYRQSRALTEARFRRETLHDLGSHAVDALLWWAELAGAGLPTAVAAMQAASAEEPAEQPGAPLQWTLLIRLASGATATLSVSRVAAGCANAMEVLAGGASGALRLSFETDRHGVERAEAGPAGWTPLPVPPDLELDYASFPAYHFDRIVGALRGEERFPDFRQGLRVLAVLDAAQAAATGGGVVPLALD
ncbi:MAG TPA: Gfo/Idh/MocA family oxidoreductase [Chloroflexota bacterium]